MPSLSWLTVAARSLIRQKKVLYQPARYCSVSSASLDRLPGSVRRYVEEKVSLCQPSAVHVCDGSAEENQRLLTLMSEQGMVERLNKYENCWITQTDPADVARVESKTFIVTDTQRETAPIPVDGVKGELANWMSPQQYDEEFNKRFPGCMKGRTMYVIPFSMGPVGSPLSKVGVELTDSPYVVASMRIMTRMGQAVLDHLGESDHFVKALHSVGQPLPMKDQPINNWPCNPGKTIITHIPSRNEICSFGSGYGGNSLLGKKCFALRLGSILARDEGWLAEHMLIVGITDPKGRKRYIAAAFPSACGKTNLAMMTPSLPGYKVECVGDDIAWMRFDSNGQLRAINPEAGFFGVAPGTSYKTNPKAMDTIATNTLFTNVAKTSDGGVFWKDIDPESVSPGATITSWEGIQNWSPDMEVEDGGIKRNCAAHPNSRFCTPASQCPIMDPAWEEPQGVPIDAIVFGGRRPEGVPLVYEALNWRHGVFIGSSLRSETTAAAADVKVKVIAHDPFAMRPFFGYNFGHYMSHWMSLDRPGRKLPKIFHVNWFRKERKPDGSEGGFLWPGFGENIRVMDWVMRRVEGEDCAQPSAIGLLPSPGSINTQGIENQVNMDQLFSLPKEFWVQEVAAIEKYLKEQVTEDLPEDMVTELEQLKDRVHKM